jgi:radical SAM superfamily enzyme YgiQ (UPF0313 family)
MRILLIRPSPPDFTIGLKNIMVCEPLELEYIAAGLANHEVEIYDMILENHLEEKLRSFMPEVVGTSSYITGVHEVKSICMTARECNPGVLTIVGGVHATLNPEDYIDPSVDLIVPGEGIAAMRKIMDEYSKGNDIRTMPGYRYRGSILYGGGDKDELVVDADALPFPRRDLVRKYAHNYYYLFHQPVSLIKTTFGCPFHCTFCYCWRLTDGKVYSRSAESVVQELLQIKNKEIYIVDDTFFVSRKHVMDIHQRIVEHNIHKHFLVYGHASFIVRYPEVIKAWSEIGLKACIVGLESPRDDELDNYEKNATVEMNDRAISILRENHVDVYASFIVDPDWTRKDFLDLEKYIRRNRLFYVVIQPLTPLAGTGIHARYENQLIIPEKYKELWDMQHTVLKTRLEERDFYRQIRRIYVRTIFNPFRTLTLHLTTAPPVFSRKYIRLLLGCYRIYKDLKLAHTHMAQLQMAGNK